MRNAQIESVRARINTLSAELLALRFDETTFGWNRDERIDGQSMDLYNTQNVHTPIGLKTFVKCYKVYINRSKTAPAPHKAVLSHGHSRAPDKYLHFKAVVDTGCESTIFRGNAGKFLIETSPSNMIVGGFEGDQVIGASIQGIAHCYAISNDPT